MASFMERALAVFQPISEVEVRNHFFPSCHANSELPESGRRNFNILRGVFDIMFYPHNSGQMMDNIAFSPPLIHIFSPVMAPGTK